MASILVVDDDRALRQIMARMLIADGHSVVEAGNGREALQLLASGAPDIAITDMFMPEKDGIETVREMRSRFPAMKILAISGGGRAGRFDFLRIAQGFGADIVLEKPFHARTLLAAVGNLLAAV